MSNSKSNNNDNVVTTKIMTRCPHCGVKLSSWEQVLLNVDRALMCKNCWYLIILDVGKSGETDKDNSKEEQ